MLVYGQAVVFVIKLQYLVDLPRPAVACVINTDSVHSVCNPGYTAVLHPVKNCRK